MTCHVCRESPFRVNRCLANFVVTHSCFPSDLSLSRSLCFSKPPLSAVGSQVISAD